MPRCFTAEAVLLDTWSVTTWDATNTTAVSAPTAAVLLMSNAVVIVGGTIAVCVDVFMQ